MPVWSHVPEKDTILSLANICSSHGWHRPLEISPFGEWPKEVPQLGLLCEGRCGYGSENSDRLALGGTERHSGHGQEV